ncbi:hypothetical protein M8756_16375 [Lutimaribacter sp. EGI FJ00015]|uniref:Uncharacterized protein n=1 Tax=Lutimaribacter degradans TaxID=2945989 RepID=A0ACC5ZZB0_9RHOB|nr:hypothetical protein [Lutimaribacter sp. EGI FJ00013]MCM2563708.1 hypothetical protein [Lutimaribacter sp. EGI FJ00013]MCO0614892.1 hypothetical protein [Lutimaribacter sp. EGI FJ00015]
MADSCFARCVQQTGKPAWQQGAADVQGITGACKKAPPVMAGQAVGARKSGRGTPGGIHVKEAFQASISERIC